MRMARVPAVALVMMACAVSDADTEVSASAEAIAYAEQTDRAIDAALRASGSTELDAGAKYQAVLTDLNRRHDAAQRVVARVKQQPPADRMPCLLLLSHVGRESADARELLIEIALAKPNLPQPSQSQHDPNTDYERTLGQSFAAAMALADRSDVSALNDIYANADTKVAAVAAGFAASIGLLDSDSIQILNGRGIGGTFQPIGISEISEAELGADPVDSPVEGPQ